MNPKFRVSPLFNSLLVDYWSILDKQLVTAAACEKKKVEVGGRQLRVPQR
jgi:hypothetical protein